MTDTQNGGVGAQVSYNPQVAQAAAMLKARQISQTSAYQGQSDAYQPYQPAQQRPDAFGSLGADSGANPMNVLMEQHEAGMADFQRRAQAMMAVHQAYSQRTQAAQRQAQMQGASGNQEAAEGLQRIWAMQDRAAAMSS